MEYASFTATDNDDGRRLDRIVRRFLPDVPLSAVYKYIRKGLIRLDSKKCTPNSSVASGMRIDIADFLLHAPGAPSAPSAPGAPSAPSAPLLQPSLDAPLTTEIHQVLLRTKDLVVYNKPAGIPVHGEGGLDRLIGQTAEASASLSFRSGPLHRLDRDTSGLLVFSRTLAGAQWFSARLADHSVKKYYIGIVCGMLTKDVQWTTPSAAGKPMRTGVHPLVSTDTGYTLVQFALHTGRKHQIRIQAAEAGCPLYGDHLYGKPVYGQTYSLHAWKLEFPADRFDDIPESLTAPIPDDFISRLESMFGKNALAQKENGELYWMQDEELQ